MRCCWFFYLGGGGGGGGLQRCFLPDEATKRLSALKRQYLIVYGTSRSPW